MKALTICQPHAHFIVADHDELLEVWSIEAKRIENRGWYTPYRGPLLIHAGKSRKWLAEWENQGTSIPGMVFGAFVGVCDLKDCWSCEHQVPPWILEHQHTDKMSDFWWELANVRRFNKPIPYRGAQGLFNVPNEVIATELQTA